MVVYRQDILFDGRAWCGTASDPIGMNTSKVLQQISQGIDSCSCSCHCCHKPFLLQVIARPWPALLRHCMHCDPISITTLPHSVLRSQASFDGLLLSPLPPGE